MSSIVNKVKDALHKDDDKNTTTTHTNPQGTTTTGHTATTGTHTTHGQSNVADPRFDAGREHRSGLSSGAVGGAGTTGTGYTASDNYTTGGGPGPASNTAGPHSSNMANKADPRVDSDMDRSRNMGANPHGTSNTSGPLSGTTGPTGTTHTTTHGAHQGVTHGVGHDNVHQAGVVGSGPGPASNTAGPHSSNMANKADPRVDSDMDRSRNVGMNPQGTSTTHGTTHDATTFGSTHGATRVGATQQAPIGTTQDNTFGSTHGNTFGTTQQAPIRSTQQAPIGGTHQAGVVGSGPGPASNTAGPHGSDMMNKADPRVDSDMDRSRNMGMNPQGTSTTTGPMSGNTHSATGTTHGATGTHGVHNTTGPNTGLTGTNQTHTTHGTHGTHGTTGTTGTTGLTGSTHDTHGTHGTHGTNTTGTADNNFNGSGPGPAGKTAGPHKSDLLNKLDPRVDSNLDGSKTVGGDKTFNQS